MALPILAAACRTPDQPLQAARHPNYERQEDWGWPLLTIDPMQRKVDAMRPDSRAWRCFMRASTPSIHRALAIPRARGPTTESSARSPAMVEGQI